MVEHSLSLGALFAFVACRDQFSARGTALIDKCFELRTLRLHADRVADIVMTPAEVDPSPGAVNAVPELRTITMRNVTFRYAASEPAVVEELSLDVAQGECVAITGPSGCGKTTLVKIMLGLIEPQAGSVLLGGLSIGEIPRPSLRNAVAAVMQDDTLFSGTVLENITFFASEPDLRWAQECARLAAVDDEISAMPMGYHSLVGGNGNGLSGGQRQRLLLARALYRKPSILILDEATSHLDITNEILVSEAVRALCITRIIIAHRKETIERADRIIRLDRGRIVRATEMAECSMSADFGEAESGKADRTSSAKHLEKV